MSTRLIEQNDVSVAGSTLAVKSTSQSAVSDDQIFFRLLNAVGNGSDISQRKLASDLGIALGLVNLCIKHCVHKGLIKVEQVPTRRYAYYLTPKGFAEKSRMAREFLSWSMSFFRQARIDCSAVVAEARDRKWKSVGILGAGELGEIMMLCATEQDLRVTAIVDCKRHGTKILGVTVLANLEEAAIPVTSWIVADLDATQNTYESLVRAVGSHRVIVPTLLKSQISVPEAVK